MIESPGVQSLFLRRTLKFAGPRWPTWRMLGSSSSLHVFIAPNPVGSLDLSPNIDRLLGPKKRERQRHGQCGQRVDGASRCALVKLAPPSRVASGDRMGGGAPLVNRVRTAAQLPLDDHTFARIWCSWP